MHVVARIAAIGCRRAVLALLALTPRLFAQNAPATAPSVIPASDVPALRATLLAPDSRQESRDQAARRLCVRGSPDAIGALRQALIDPSAPDAQLAAARGMASEFQPDPSLIDPLFVLLEQSSRRPAFEAAARALTAYKTDPAVLLRLIAVLERDRSEPRLIAVTRAIGSFLEKRAAGTLVTRLARADLDPDLGRAAAEALTEMTGLTESGDDPVAWTAWWRQQQGLSDIEFRQRLLESRSLRYERMRLQYDALADELPQTLSAQYAALPPERRGPFLLQQLRSAQPAIRAAAAVMLQNEFRTSALVDEAARIELRSMIADSDARVRLRVALALSDLNDADAIVPLLTQLRLESQPPIRAALIRAISPIQDPRAIDPLIERLGDQSIETAAEAAAALGELAKRAEPAADVRARIAGAIRRTFEARFSGATGPREQPFREALLASMVPLESESLVPIFQGVLNARQPRESVRARRSAIQGLSRFGHQQGPFIFPAVNDDEGSIRLEAVRALRGVAESLADVNELLKRRLDPGSEPDSTIRDAAWEVMEPMVSEASEQQLIPWIQFFHDEHTRRASVLRRLEELAEQAGDLSSVAGRRQQLGDAYFQLGQFPDAAELYQQALDYSKSTPGAPNKALDTRSGLTMDARLAARQYEAARLLADDMIKLNRAEFATTMLSKLFNEGDRLVRGGAFDDAAKLLGEIRKLQLPLEGKYARLLAELDTAIRDRRVG